MTDDWLDVQTNTVGGIDKKLEGPAIFYDPLTKYYYLWCSGVTGWNPNAASVHRSRVLRQVERSHNARFVFIPECTAILCKGLRACARVRVCVRRV